MDRQRHGPREGVSNPPGLAITVQSCSVTVPTVRSQVTFLMSWPAAQNSGDGYALDVAVNGATDATTTSADGRTSVTSEFTLTSTWRFTVRTVAGTHWRGGGLAPTVTRSLSLLCVLLP